MVELGEFFVLLLREIDELFLLWPNLANVLAEYLMVCIHLEKRRSQVSKYIPSL